MLCERAQGLWDRTPKFVGSMLLRTTTWGTAPCTGSRQRRQVPSEQIVLSEVDQRRWPCNCVEKIGRQQVDGKYLRENCLPGTGCSIIENQNDFNEPSNREPTHSRSPYDIEVLVLPAMIFLGSGEPQACTHCSL